MSVIIVSVKAWCDQIDASWSLMVVMQAVVHVVNNCVQWMMLVLNAQLSKLVMT